MTVISSIITDAYRESNIIPIGAVPTDAMNTEALRLYNGIVAGIWGTDVGELLRDWPLGDFGRDPENPLTGYYPLFDYRWTKGPPINARLIASNSEAMTVDFTGLPQDGARMSILDPYGRLATVPVTLNGNGRTIEGQPTLLLDTDGTSTTWFYRADLGDWVKISTLALTDDNPFPIDFDQLFVCRLAIRINPRFGRQLDPLTAEVLQVVSRDFKARYINSQPLDVDDSISWPFMSRQGYDTQRSFTSTPGFSRGRPYG